MVKFIGQLFSMLFMFTSAGNDLAIAAKAHTSAIKRDTLKELDLTEEDVLGKED